MKPMMSSAHCRETLRATDIIGRLGGEEFGILLPETPFDIALEVAGRLASHPGPHGRNPG
jgi:GGDEF domain-containing protein